MYFGLAACLVRTKNAYSSHIPKLASRTPSRMFRLMATFSRVGFEMLTCDIQNVMKQEPIITELSIFNVLPPHPTLVMSNIILIKITIYNYYIYNKYFKNPICSHHRFSFMSVSQAFLVSL